MRKSFYLAIIFLAVALAFYPFSPQSGASAGYSWKVTEISRVLTSNIFITREDKVFRIIGISPLNELSPDKKEACHYRSNSREIKDLLLNNELLTAEDEKIKDALHLKIDKEYVTEIILRNGWAKMNDDPVSSYFQSRFKKAQEFAKNEKLGLWALCPNDLNWQKIRENFGGRIRDFKSENTVFLGQVGRGEVEEVLSGNEFKLKNGPVVKLQNVEIPTGKDPASVCFRENSRNYLENLLLNKKVRIEKEVNSREITDYKLVRNVFLIGSRIKSGKTKRSINQQMIADGFGKFSQTLSPDSRESGLGLLQKEVYKNPRGAWLICARDILNTDFSAKKEEEIREIDESCPIKGNISGTKKSPIKTYHTVLSGWYERIQSERCFENEEEAEVAGFRKIK